MTGILSPAVPADAQAMRRVLAQHRICRRLAHSSGLCDESRHRLYRHELIERLHHEHLERQAAMHSRLDEAHQHVAAKPATADDVHRPQPSAQRLGSVPISRSETARWRSRISSSSALARAA